MPFTWSSGTATQGASSSGERASVMVHLGSELLMASGSKPAPRELARRIDPVNRRSADYYSVRLEKSYGGLSELCLGGHTQPSFCSDSG